MIRQEPPPDIRPGALLRHGLSRGALLVLLPVVLAGQAFAWLAYAITGFYSPWSWIKIGLAYSLASVRVPFDVTAVTSDAEVVRSELVIALGALTILVLVLAFRAGAMQGRGLERRPVRAALAGALIAPGFALPLWGAAFLVVLRFPNLDVDRLAPDPVLALVLPLLVAGVAGGIGGLSVARAALEARGGWRATGAGAARAAGSMLWLGIAFSFVAFLVLAATQLDQTQAYARFVGSGAGGAVAIVHHALLLPNQSAMLLGVFAGSPAELALGRSTVTIAIDGITDPRGILVEQATSFPAWFWLFVLVPAAAAFLGGRAAAEKDVKPREALRRAGLGGVGFAALAGLTVWAASIRVPILAAFGAELTLGNDPWGTVLLILPFGVLAGLPGAWWGTRPKRPTG
ncbi:MAG TPA: hypothetical protein VF235_06265 [Actinomycetota bacterium]